MLSAAQAQEREDPLRAAAELAGFHCRLWLSQINNDYQVDRKPDYIRILGRGLGPDDAAYLHEATLGGLPDFGFILESRWNFATRGDRYHYALYLLRFLNHQFGFSRDDSGRYCSLDISLALKEQHSSTDDFVELPQPRLFTARAYTLLPGKAAAIAVNYDLEQDLSGWRIAEITLKNVPLAATYGNQFNTLLVKGGYAHLTAWLINQVPQKEGTTPPAPPE